MTGEFGRVLEKNLGRIRRVTRRIKLRFYFRVFLYASDSCFANMLNDCGSSLVSKHIQYITVSELSSGDGTDVYDFMTFRN